MKIEEVLAFDDDTRAAIDRLLNQLVTREISVSIETLSELVADSNSHLFMAVDEKGRYLGMLTVGIYLSPTGKKGWVEDVVVDAESRGKGVGDALIQHAIEFAKGQGVARLMLTSRPVPERDAAHGLYRKAGFEIRETNTYQLDF